MDTKKVFGWALPAGETHLEDYGWAARFGVAPEESSRILESLGATVVARVVDDLFFRWPSHGA